MTSSSAATQREATAQSYVDEYEFPALSEEGGSWVGGGGLFWRGRKGQVQFAQS